MTTPLDALIAQRKSKARPCLVQQFIDALPPAHSKAFQALLATPQVETVEIRRRTQQAGLPIGENTIRRHRKGDCCCPKEA